MDPTEIVSTVQWLLFTVHRTHSMRKRIWKLNYIYTEGWRLTGHTETSKCECYDRKTGGRKKSNDSTEKDKHFQISLFRFASRPLALAPSLQLANLQIDGLAVNIWSNIAISVSIWSIPVLFLSICMWMLPKHTLSVYLLVERLGSLHHGNRKKKWNKKQSRFDIFD